MSSEVPRKSGSSNFLFVLDGDKDTIILPSLLSMTGLDDIWLILLLDGILFIVALSVSTVDKNSSEMFPTVTDACAGDLTASITFSGPDMEELFIQDPTDGPTEGPV